MLKAIRLCPSLLVMTDVRVVELRIERKRRGLESLLMFPLVREGKGESGQRIMLIWFSFKC